MAHSRMCRAAKCTSDDAQHCCATAPASAPFFQHHPVGSIADAPLLSLIVGAAAVVVGVSVALVFHCFQPSKDARSLELDSECLSPKACGEVWDPEAAQLRPLVTPQRVTGRDWNALPDLAIYTVSADGRHRYITPLRGAPPPAGIPVYDRPLPWGPGATVQ